MDRRNNRSLYKEFNTKLNKANEDEQSCVPLAADSGLIDSRFDVECLKWKRHSRAWVQVLTTVYIVLASIELSNAASNKF